MFINLDFYRAFYFVARTNSISKAAQELFLSQPAVSQSIKQLEHKLGCQLFFRTPRGVRLTPEGTVLYGYIEQSYNLIVAAEKNLDQMQNLVTGEIRVGAGDTLCKHYLLPFLETFNQKFPGVKIKVTNRTTDETLQLLHKGMVDIGIVNLPINDAGVDIFQGITIQDCFVAGGKHKKLAGRPLSLAELLKHPVLLLEKETNTRKYIDDFFKKNGHAIVPEIELGSIDLLVEFTRIGLGISCVVKDFIQDKLKRKELFEIKTTPPLPPRHIGIVALKKIPATAAVREFLKIVGVYSVQNKPGNLSQVSGIRRI
jgi:DNA-binding transcriptional LysR family regulator